MLHDRLLAGDFGFAVKQKAGTLDETANPYAQETTN